MGSPNGRLRARSRLGKYRIEALLGEGGFACVYRAFDTIEGLPVALRVPSEHPLSQRAEEDFLKEIRLVAKLEHPHILPVRNADRIDGRLVVATPLAKETLADRLSRRLAWTTSLAWGEQLLDALAFAHESRVLHLDVKPENVLLFDDGRIRLGDFGLARITYRTIAASGSGTLGHMAPEQAMGRPSPRSDVFSAGLILWRMFTGVYPSWPFEWPLKGHAKLERRYPPEMVRLLRKALHVKQRQRYADAGEMAARYRAVIPKVKAWRAGGVR
ncbi:MAG: serine/threonine protein kinase [Planctomycetes bacterium]|nr:serine/threonine protein kinase [Planctomycetota bacterium]MCB9899782.1 serine/threonine protein kinase [Planctomycetota bacterium]